MNVYKADVALLAGDLTGKAIVPIVRANGGYTAELLGVRRTADEGGLAQLERDIADVGYYSFVTSADEAERLVGDEAARDELLERLMGERIAAWMELATQRPPDRERATARLADGEVPLYLIPGNDDSFGIDPILNGEGYAPINADGRVLDIPG